MFYLYWTMSVRAQDGESSKVFITKIIARCVSIVIIKIFQYACFSSLAFRFRDKNLSIEKLLSYILCVGRIADFSLLLY